MRTRMAHSLTKIRRLISRSEWAVRLLSLPKSIKESSQSGLLLIQIDGLARHQLESALKKGKMPFLQTLLKSGEYQLQSMYSGLPSSTPAVQGELFYGVRSAVPAFSFLDRRTNRLCSMLERDSATLIERKLQEHNEGIFTGGSVYSDIYSGGAGESHYCPGIPGMGLRKHSISKVSLILLLFLHIVAVFRIGILMLMEFVLAIIDCLRGLIAKEKLFAELIFVATRVGICILLRELITFGAKVDLARGLPIIHLNFLGYDEQAHRRGPSSAFAHWTLKGIDRSIKHLWQAAHRSRAVHYDLWIYSDHGQQDVDSYLEKTGQLVGDAVVEAVQSQRNSGQSMSPLPPFTEYGVQLERSRWLGIPFPINDLIYGGSEADDSIIVTAKGPIGHVYLNQELPNVDINNLAADLVASYHIPLVMVKDGDTRVKAWTSSGLYSLPEDAAIVLGKNHPFLQEVTDDLVQLVHHENAGDLVISGWSPSSTKSLSFPLENGAHAGPGTEETCAFALLPLNAKSPRPQSPYLRPHDLFLMIKDFRERKC